MRILLTSDCLFLRLSLSVYYKTVLRRFLGFVFVVGLFAFLFNPARGVAASEKLPVTIVPSGGDVRIVTPQLNPGNWWFGERDSNDGRLTTLAICKCLKSTP